MFKLRVRYPTMAELNAILDRTTQTHAVSIQRIIDGPSVLGFRDLIRETPIAAHVRDFAARIIMGTHPDWDGSPQITKRVVRYGASPRGAQSLVLGAKVRALTQGRFNVSVEDLKALAVPALRHRVILNFAGESEGIDTDKLITQVVESGQESTSQNIERMAS